MRGRDMIQMVVKWQIDTCSRFDMILEQYLESDDSMSSNDMAQFLVPAVPEAPKVDTSQKNNDKSNNSAVVNEIRKSAPTTPDTPNVDDSSVSMDAANDKTKKNTERSPAPSMPSV